jgi:uncharacterized protein (TIGR02147 family)
LRGYRPGAILAFVSRNRRGEPDVFEYLDYRAFLRDLYRERKTRGRGFSFRAFSRRAGLKSPNYLKLVMDGERNLTPPMAERFARACGLEDESAEHFVDLVGFSQAETASQRNRHYERLTSSQSYRKAHRLDLAHAAYHSTWYMPAIRELAAHPGFVADPAWIARTLYPPISRSEARRALDTLTKLGLLVTDATGRTRQGEAQLTTGPETRSLHIANYHRMMMQRAAEAIDLFPSEDRDISSLTLAMGEDGVRRLKARIQRFRRELLELSALEDGPGRVVQVNFQLFPLTIDPADAPAPEAPAGTRSGERPPRSAKKESTR